MRSRSTNAPRIDERPEKRRSRCVAGTFAVVVLALVATGAATPAYAYIDPGTGGMLLQLLLGGVAGAAVIVRLYWQRLKAGFQRLTGSHDDPSSADHNRDADR
jgi:hypothetical protein